MLIRLDVESKLSEQLKVRRARGAQDGPCAPHLLQATLQWLQACEQGTGGAAMPDVGTQRGRALPSLCSWLSSMCVGTTNQPCCSTCSGAW